MAFDSVFKAPNAFSPQYEPAVISQFLPYVSPTTGLINGSTVYNFYGSNFVTTDADNYIDRFLLMEKGNQEIYANSLVMNVGDSITFTTPHGNTFRWYKSDYWISGRRYFLMTLYANDGQGEFIVSSIDITAGYQRWCSFQIDNENELATVIDWTLMSTNPANGQAQFTNATQISDANKHRLYNILLDAYIPEDPYEAHNNNYDSSIGGDGNYDETSDTIVEGTLPTYGGNTSGMCTAYVPDLQQINALANRLADPTIYQVLGNTLLKMEDLIIGLSIFPFAVPKITATHQLRINLVGVYIPSGIYLDKANGQYHTIDCGSINVNEYWGNCLDYNPYTKVSIYLPFCGFYELDTDDVMGKTLHVTYRVDIMSGVCLASIIVDGSVMYQYSGQCSSQIPISSVSFDSFIQSMISVGVATATGGAGLAAAGASAAVGHARADSNDNKDMAQLQHNQVQASYTKTVLDSGVSTQGALANVVLSAKGQYKHAGAMQGIAGFMGVKTPYLIIKRPNQQIPTEYGKYHGYPSITKAKLSELEGYTVVDDIRLNIPEATVEEIIECEKLLKGGIVI